VYSEFIWNVLSVHVYEINEPVESNPQVISCILKDNINVDILMLSLYVRTDFQNGPFPLGFPIRIEWEFEANVWYYEGWSGEIQNS